MDDTLNLAFSLHKNRGVYALLLGAGISQSVGIPMGSQIAQDLIRIVNGAGGELSEETGYDVLLETLGKLPTERNTIIRQYFEPNPTEQERGLKVPSVAHKAIAQLVKDGYIKLIFTTNFDRLLELALEEIGVTPDVIFSDDMIVGAPPIRHSKVTIVKLHGDYRDIKTLNTTRELEEYSETKNLFLDNLLPEYGLIVCGWSAKWDGGLRKAIYRIKPTWYSTYWIEPFQPSEAASGLIKHRHATVIQATADKFFIELQRKVEALDQLNRAHPLSISVAVERVKKLLPHETTQIELEDLLRDEANKVFEDSTKIEKPTLPPNSVTELELITNQVAFRFAKIETLLHMILALCWYGKGQQESMLTLIERRWTITSDIYLEASGPRKIPTLLMMYIGGIAALAHSNWIYLSALITKPKVDVQLNGSRSIEILEFVNKHTCFKYNVDPLAFNDPVSAFLRQQLRPLFQDYIPIDRDFISIFNLFEMILALLSVNRIWIGHDAPIDVYFDHKELEDFWRKGGSQGSNWGFVREFYGGDKTRLMSDLEKYSSMAKASRNRRTLPNYAAIYSQASN